MATVEEKITDLQNSNANLTSAVSSYTTEIIEKMGQIDARVAAKEQEVDTYLSNARLQQCFVRLTRNQYGHITDNVLDHYSVNSTFNISFSEHRTISSGTPWESRDAEEKEIMTAMGIAGRQHFRPPIKVIRMTWDGWNSTKPRHTFHQAIHLPSTATVASYAKLISGEIYEHGFQGITNEWGLCGRYYQHSPGGYANTHPHVASASGEVLFTWYAAVSGYVPLNRESPQWGFYLHPESSESADYSI